MNAATPTGYIPDAVLRRLCGALNLLPSRHPGEQAAAVAAIQRIVAAHDIVWENLLFRRDREPAFQSAAPPSWLQQLAFVLIHPDRLTVWEREFAAGLRGRSAISPRQRQVLAGIADRLEAELHQ